MWYKIQVAWWKWRMAETMLGEAGPVTCATTFTASLAKGSLWGFGAALGWVLA